ncbi:MAG: helix-turn-helix domain-containing protein [Solirubrobacteraceae bacterium]
MDKQSLELLLAQGASVESIGRRFGKHPSTISYWMAKHGLVAPNREKHTAKGGLERGRLELLVEAGGTIAEIAAEVGLSKTTVRHWLRRYGLKTRNKVGPRRAFRRRPQRTQANFICALSVRATV